MSGMRMIAFLLAVLLAAEALAPEWELLAAVFVLAVISIRDVYGLVFAVLAGILLAQEPDPSRALLIVAAAFAGVSTLLRAAPDCAPARLPPGVGPRGPLADPALLRRLRRWERVSDF